MKVSTLDLRLPLNLRFIVKLSQDLQCMRFYDSQMSKRHVMFRRTTLEEYTEYIKFFKVLFE